MAIVLSQRIDLISNYKDIPFSVYHYPKRYRNQVKQGDTFIYYQGDRSTRGNRYYFGVGVIGEIEVLNNGEDYYAHILSGVRFPTNVEIYNPEGGYYESLGRTSEKPAWQWSARQISDDAFIAILHASGCNYEEILQIAEVEKSRDPLETLYLFNKKYRDFAPERRDKVISAHIDRGVAVTNSLKQILGPKCQVCLTEGFMKQNGERYVEAHHLTQLSVGDSKSLCSENVILVCPNCHREIHYGHTVLEEKGEHFELIVGQKKAVIRKNTIEYLRQLRAE